jgi:DNA (cytosine-5)-methyltransferase 1
MSLGFEQAGFDIAAAIEIDPIHSAVHEYNFPHSVSICASVTDISGNQIRQKADIGDADIDVVFGGAPCQGFSLMGKRALDDPRNQLVFHYVRLVAELHPKYCVFENVKGLTLGAHAGFLRELIEALENVGYRVLQPYRVLNAADFSVPQDRRRLFLIAARSDMQLPDYPEALIDKTTVWDAIGDLPDADAFEQLSWTDEVAACWQTTSRYASRLRGKEIDPTDFSYPRHFDADRLTSSLRTEHTALSKSRFAATEHGKTEAVSRFRKLPPDGLCNTLRAGTDSARGAFTSPRPIHPYLPRVITVREAARLHSYPDWFRFHATKWHGFRQIGNSVPPMMARGVGAKILEAMSMQPLLPANIVHPGEPELLTLVMESAAQHFQVSRHTIAQRLRKPTSLNQSPLWDKTYA